MPKLDAEGHRWWAALCRHKQEAAIGECAKAKTEEEQKEWVELARSWKRSAEEHEAKANSLEEK